MYKLRIYEPDKYWVIGEQPPQKNFFLNKKKKKTFKESRSGHPKSRVKEYRAPLMSASTKEGQFISASSQLIGPIGNEISFLFMIYNFTRSWILIRLQRFFPDLRTIFWRQLSSQAITISNLIHESITYLRKVWVQLLGDNNTRVRSTRVLLLPKSCTRFHITQ